MGKKDAEMMALKQENGKLKEENEALKAGTSPVCLVILILFIYNKLLLYRKVRQSQPLPLPAILLRK
jgi:hypothetical protein